ncbi:MarR family transcriptional regulator [Cryobacterium sp. LW097]|uniref:MarR family winged helix-turn-helix transcriptional regulator n=1 Tax=unclassified Cryobacterium TaxID=2649013 RepID=UPI000B4CBE30|nr:MULTISPECIES: MarR family transcriptional regulator [unclassified Cryobacterium]ASD22759.1 MarR family transcriptional regulator [Cryobacterium sp. LW097]TFC50416.1 MarR family transcriptional regulator [Cryobacterium sp. TMB3-1-2]TFC60754.1 MarR family transcriptional regulator [Cryobacterium sp. TMB1-7]TFC71849.1 MarR family transcriptional regulator [Cryobacterium sp. TMB3-15]TFC78442.1 MarR family transcriptional regulator [Cryobacterium sp. TMB3-10]
MDTNETPAVQGLNQAQLHAWLRFVAVVELVPGLLDSQLQRDSDLSHFEYYVLAMLSEAPDHTLRMTGLSSMTNSSLPRLSHVVRRLEDRGLVKRTPCPSDRRATNASLTEEGWTVVQAAAPGHVRTVRENVIDPLTDEQVAQLDAISNQLLMKLDPTNRLNPGAPKGV